MSTFKSVFLLLFSYTTIFSQTIYVNGSLPTNGDGTSWATAFNNLDDAIAGSNLSTNEIWVAKGTYYPAKDRTGNSNPADNRTKTFHINKNLKLYGGFLGNELTISERIIGDNPTILSGDLGIPDNNTDNSYHVLIITGPSGGIIDGFIIQKGNAYYTENDNFSSSGGGIFYLPLSSASFNISNCIFNDNQAIVGGAIYSSPYQAITNCVFNNNKAIFGGGAIYIVNGQYIENCVFNNNKTGGSGGAIFNVSENYTTSHINNSTFFNNEASSYGNAIYHYIDVTYPTPQGAYCNIKNTIFKDANNGRKEIVLSGWGDMLGVVGDELFYYLNNCISDTDIPMYSYEAPTGLEKIIKTNFLIANPLFINESNPIGPDNKWRTADDGLRLKPCSPAINAGDNSFVPVDITTDIAGEPRIQLGTVDIGAYESNSNTLPTMAMENTSVTENQAGTTLYYNDCDKLTAKVVSPAASPGVIPIAGNTTAKVWNEPVPVNSLFVSRHYEITPQQNSLTATGHITLYFTQSEFDAYNDLPNHYYDLPAAPEDEASKAFLEVLKFSGVSNDNSGLPNTYSGSISKINPLDQDIIWNANENRWEISFNVTGFSGFFVRAILGLPLNLLSFSANHKNETIELNWKTANEVNTKSFEIERSEEGTKFIKIGTIASKNNSETNEYRFIDNQFSNFNSNTLYYRLKMIDLDGKFTYSKIVAIEMENDKSVTISPNPTSGKSTLNLGNKTEFLNTIATITNSAGIAIKQFKINKLTEEIDLNSLPKAVYLIKFVDGSTLKVVKE
jgi:hypothetical protein